MFALPWNLSCFIDAAQNGIVPSEREGTTECRVETESLKFRLRQIGLETSAIRSYDEQVLAHSYSIVAPLARPVVLEPV